MRVLILGGDGYLGWPTAMRLAMRGHDVRVVDSYLRRLLALRTDSEALMPNPALPERVEIFRARTGKVIEVDIGDLADWEVMARQFHKFRPDVVIHYAEQPSAPYSMMGRAEAALTLNNNLSTTFNLIWAALDSAPDVHIIKIGTMGEYGTPDIDIEEGWIEIESKGRRDKFLYPRQAGSLYHTTKIMDTDLLWFYVRIYGLRVTDLMQGPVYGLLTEEAGFDEKLLPNFHYDDIFGTVVNRFLAQAVACVPLTVYGEGGQTRGYLNIEDTLQCVELAMLSPPGAGKLRILNQFTESFSVRDIAEKVKRVGDGMGFSVEVESVENPRKELEEHYYNPSNSGFLELGLKPRLMTDEVIEGMLRAVARYKDRIDKRKIAPRVRWRR